MKKFISFLAFACLIALFSNYTLSQTRRKTTTSTKRAASMQKTKPATSTAKRAAVSSTSTKRAATSSTATRRAATNRRNASSNIAKRAATRRAAQGSNSSKNSKSNTCPIGVVIKKVIDDNGNDVYYSEKDTVCTEPENVMGTTDLTGLRLPTWIAGKNAYVFSCNYGFIKSKKDNVDICIDQNVICPLNTTISKKDNKYYNPFTNEECNLPAFASTLKLNEETNMNTAIPADEAYYSYCNKNYYKTSDVECKACPTGKYNNGASIKYENITDSENKVIGKKSSLIEGATSESQCYTMEELKVMQAN
ncbi:hypothetical protein HDR59_03190 [bacterium]|nr:hypothetical protein [bacterium]